MEITGGGQGRGGKEEPEMLCTEHTGETGSDIMRWLCRSSLLRDFGMPEYCAHGASGTVYRVERDGRKYALKLIECGQDLHRLKRAQNEIALMQKLGQCRNVVQLIDSEVLRDNGETAVALLEPFLTTFEEYYKSHSMTVKDVLKLGVDICTALDDCWKAGVAHLDVQPKNIFVDEKGRFCLGDFGAAVAVPELAQEQLLRGTLSYMAPEVYERREYSQASDIYSLGMVLYCLLNKGNLPYMELDDSVKTAVMFRMTRKGRVPLLRMDDALDQMLQRAMDVESGLRYQSFEEMGCALCEVGNQMGLLLCDAPPAASPAGRMSPKRSLLFGLQKIKNGMKPSDEKKVPPQLHISDENQNYGNLFSPDSYACRLHPEEDMQIPGFGRAEPAKAAGVSPMDIPSAPAGTTLFSSDTLLETLPPDAPAQMPSHAGVFSPVEPEAFPVMDNPPESGSGSEERGHCGRYAEADSSAPRMSQVQFSAIAPKEARKDDYSIIQIFMYEQAFRRAVEEAITVIDTPVQEKRSGFQNVLDNTRVKIVLTCPDMPIDDNVQEQVWCGGYLQFDFAICPPEDFKKRQILLTATVFFDDIPATRLMLTIKALASYDEEIELARKDVITAFVSYASQDRNRVGSLIQGMRKARPDMDIFFDVMTLRSGENWESALYQEILRRDVLFLCWSKNAMASEWVEREWRFALEHKGLEGIEPIPLERPDECPPPKELWSKHFNDSLLYIINR